MLKGMHLTLMIGPVVAQAVPKSVIDALRKVQVTSSANQRSGFQLTFAFSSSSPLNRSLIPAGYFDAPNRVILTVTLNGTPTVIMDGVITRHELSVSNEPGQSIFTVTGLDITQMMDLIDFSFIRWPAMPAEARVAAILGKYAGFGIIPRIIPSVLINVPNPLDVIPAQKGTDYQYLRLLAEQVGYVFYVEPGPVPGTNLAYWGPEIKVGAAQRALTVNMDAHTNVESLSFSFDGLAKTLYILFIQNQATKVPIPIPVPDITPISPLLGAKPPLPLQVKFLDKDLDQDSEEDGLAKYNPAQAAMKALAKASQSSEVITASGSLNVLRYGHILQARKLVTVRGAGIAHDGHYYVRSVTHSIQEGEYKQSFSLSRNAFISLTSEVSP